MTIKLECEYSVIKRMKRHYKMFGNRRDKKSLIPVQASPSWASQHSDQVQSPDQRQTPQSFKPSSVPQSRKSRVQSPDQRQTPQSFKRQVVKVPPPPSSVSQSRKSRPLKSQNQRQTSPQSFKPYEVGFKVIFI